MRTPSQAATVAANATPGNPDAGKLEFDKYGMLLSRKECQAMMVEPATHHFPVPLSPPFAMLGPCVLPASHTSTPSADARPSPAEALRAVIRHCTSKAARLIGSLASGKSPLKVAGPSKRQQQGQQSAAVHNCRSRHEPPQMQRQCQAAGQYHSWCAGGPFLHTQGRMRSHGETVEKPQPAEDRAAKVQRREAVVKSLISAASSTTTRDSVDNGKGVKAWLLQHGVDVHCESEDLPSSGNGCQHSAKQNEQIATASSSKPCNFSRQRSCNAAESPAANCARGRGVATHGGTAGFNASTSSSTMRAVANLLAGRRRSPARRSQSRQPQHAMREEV